MVANSNDEPRQRHLQPEIRDLISALTGRLTALGRSSTRSVDGKTGAADAGDDNSLGIVTLAGDNKGASMKANMEELMDNAHGGMYNDDAGICTYANSNYQAVNNSILLGSSCKAEDPGLHVVISKYIEEEEEEEEDGDEEEKEEKKKNEEEKKKKKKKEEKEEKKKKKEKDKEKEEAKKEKENEDEKKEIKENIEEEKKEQVAKNI